MPLTDAPQRPKRGRKARIQPTDNLNAKLYDEGVVRAVNLATYLNGLVARVRKAGRKQDESLIERLAGQLVQLSDADIDRLKSATNIRRSTARLRAVSDTLREISERSRELALSILPELKLLAQDQAEFWVDRINGHGRELGIKLPDVKKRGVSARVAQLLVLGETVPDLFTRWASHRSELLQTTIRRQYTDGIETRGVIQGLQGPKGLLARSLDGIPSSLGPKIITAGTGSASAGALALRDQYTEFVDDLVWISTLDHRTSSICWGRHAKLVNANLNGALPPAHVKCRSVTQPWSSPHGPIPIDETAPEWMERQPASVQRRVMGPRRHDLFKTGKYEWPRDFISDRGRLWTLDDLQRRSRSRGAK